MDKFKSTLIATIMFAVMLTGQAMADVPFWMVGASGSTDEQSSFGWNEKPYLYIALGDEVVSDPSVFWFDSGDNIVIPDEIDSDGAGNFWLSASNWDDVKTLGQWDVVADNCGGAACAGTDFVVTPEPVSMVLFGLGGLPIAAHLIRRRKVNA